MRVTTCFGLVAMLVGPAALAAGAAPDRPVTVSPGGADEVEPASARCPTFSWGGSRDARSYEILVYEMTGDQVTAGSPGRRPALGVTLPGSASSWTPPADRCLTGDTAHVWFVRSLGAADTVSDWSRGGMFRTPAAAPAAELRQTIVGVVEQLLAARAAAPPAARPYPFVRDPARHQSAAAAAPARARTPDAVDVGLSAEVHDTVGAIAIGIYGSSDSDADDSYGVVGYADAASGDIHGVGGFAYSSDGSGVYGENTAISGGLGVLGADDPTTDAEPSAGVAGLSTNPNGYGGFFWNYGGGTALAVGDPEVEPIDIVFTVEADGDVWAAGLLGLEGGIDLGGNIRLLGAGQVEFEPMDSPPTCDSSFEGAIYYDASEAWLCICTKTAPAAYGWRRADDKTDDCAT